MYSANVERFIFHFVQDESKFQAKNFMFIQKIPNIPKFHKFLAPDTAQHFFHRRNPGCTEKNKATELKTKIVSNTFQSVNGMYCAHFDHYDHYDRNFATRNIRQLKEIYFFAFKEEMISY